VRPKNNENGIALILVLWVMVLLIALGTEFALSMKTEVNTTRNFKEDAEAYYLAKAGMNLAKTEILSDAQFHSWTEGKGFIFGTVSSKKDEDKAEPTPKVQTGEELEAPEPPQRTELPLGKGFIHYSIRDENGKININTATRDFLTKALVANGLPLGSERDTIVDSILDWIDTNDQHRANGAESDYYQGLSPAYSAKNGPLYILDELLKVRGITPELFYASCFEKITQLLHEKVFHLFVSLLRVQPEPMRSDNIHSTPCFRHKGQGGKFVTDVDTQILCRQAIYLRIKLSFQ